MSADTQSNVLTDTDDDPIESDWTLIRPEIVVPSETGLSRPTERRHVGPDLERLIQYTIRLVENAYGVRVARRRLIDLALSFSVLPEDVPEGMLSRERRAVLDQVASGPFYPCESSPEARTLIAIAAHLEDWDPDARAQQADRLREILYPWLPPS